MPYKSDAQRKYFNANRSKLEAKGINVDEYNKESEGQVLPERVSRKDHIDKVMNKLRNKRV